MPQHYTSHQKFYWLGLSFIILGSLITACFPRQAIVDNTPSTPKVVQPLSFTDVAETVGLDFQHGAFRWEVSGDPVAMMGGGLCWIDYDQDGWLDLFVVNSYALAEAGRWQTGEGLPQSALFHNVEGQFVEVSEETGTALALRGNGCVAADLNQDGWTDLYITTSRVNALLWNNGDGTFSEGGEVAGVDAYGWQSSTAVGDLNGDGWPDLFVAGYVDINNRIPDATSGFPNTHLGRRDLLFINQGVDASGLASFREVGEVVGLETDDFEYGLGALLTDLDRDGDLDLYVANDTNPNRLYENVAWSDGLENDPEGLGFRFKEFGKSAQVDDDNSGMGIAGADYDGDGYFDLFVTNLGQQLHSVYRNQSAAGELDFQDATGTFGVTDIGVGWTGWGTGWGDFDLDTDLDLFVANGTIPVLGQESDAQMAQIFSNLKAQGQTGQFEEWTSKTGLDEIGPLLGRGSAAADFDNDGDLDIVVSSIGGSLKLLQNNSQGSNWLQVQIAGFHPGAVVTALLPDGQKLQREIQAGSSYLSSEDPRCHFGLGDAETIVELSIRQLDGTEIILNDVTVNQLVEVEF
ncbi:MAG: CRTAC1 family protein [Chloroflexota bacterium]